MGRVGRRDHPPGVRIADAEALWYDLDALAVVRRRVQARRAASRATGRPPARCSSGSRVPDGRGRVTRDGARVTRSARDRSPTSRTRGSAVASRSAFAAAGTADAPAVRMSLTLDYELRERRAAEPRHRPALHPPRPVRRAAADAAALRPRAAGGTRALTDARYRSSARPASEETRPMFVFKAAVVGAGTMGGQIAQTIAAADIPVVLKDIRPGPRRRRPRRGPRGHRAPGRQARREGQAHRGAGAPRRSREIARADHRHDDATTASATSTSSSRPCPSGWRSSRPSSPSSTRARPGHAILASNTSSLSITEIGDATAAPRQGRRLPLLLPGVDHAADRDRRGRRDVGRDAPGRRRRSRRRSASSRSVRARCPGFVVNRILNARHQRDVARPGRAGDLSIEEIDEGVGGRRRRPGRAVPPRRPARARHGPARRRAPRRRLRRPLLRPRGHAGARRRRASSARRPAETASTHRRQREPPGAASPTSPSSSSC